MVIKVWLKHPGWFLSIQVLNMSSLAEDDERFLGHASRTGTTQARKARESAMSLTIAPHVGVFIASPKLVQSNARSVIYRGGHCSRWKCHYKSRIVSRAML